MDFRIRELNPTLEDEYNQFLAKCSASLLYHSLRYRDFLRQLIPEAEARYLLGYRNNRIEAVIPTFVKRTDAGVVVNSLPFYGSNGGLIALPECSLELQIQLLNAFDYMCQEVGALSSTIITNPLMNNSAFDSYIADTADERVGQFTPLPIDVPESTQKDYLMNLFHVKTRNMVRKGFKSGFKISEDDSYQAMHALALIHEQNIKVIGGAYKPLKVFEAIRDNFIYGNDYRVYIANKNGQVAAALLVFFYNKTAEYFTPVIQPEYRSEQPLSALIFTAMIDAVKQGCSNWNWGGTWLTQDGVYHFKSRWGTKDIKYQYLVRLYAGIEKTKKKSQSDILHQFPYFYVIPFSQLQGNDGEN